MKALFKNQTSICILFGLTILCSCGTKPKIGFVNNLELFDGFSARKELQMKLDKEFNQGKTEIDSLVSDLEYDQTRLRTVSVSDKEKETLFIKREYVLKRKQEFDYSREARNKEYTDQIWKQINDYVFQYGEENGFEFIHGASGNGSLMYGSKTADITKDVMEYINTKYEGF